MAAGRRVMLGACCPPCEARLWFHGTDLQGFRVEVEGVNPHFYLELLATERTFESWKEARERFEERSGAWVDQGWPGASEARFATGQCIQDVSLPPPCHGLIT